MAGLIWFVQVVHYPLFSAVGKDDFVTYETAHINLTSRVVGPIMAVEGITALIIPGLNRSWSGMILPGFGLVLLAVIHASTVLLQVPAHRTLASGYRRDAARRLVTSNWIRTVGWSTRTVVAGALVVEYTAT